MSVRIEKIKNYKVAYVRQVGPYGYNNVKTMEKLKKWAKSKNLLNEDAIILGIAHDDPKITPAQNCRYDACIVIPKDYQVDNSVSVIELSGGLYATLKVKHTAEDIQKAWGKIFVAIEDKGYEIDNRPMLERYAVDMISNGYCEICVPIMTI